MTPADAIVMQATAVAIDGRVLLIEGPPGSGKSSLALALIDGGAQLIGDDAVTLARVDDRLIASAPPNIAGLLEVRGVGLIRLPVAPPAPVALLLTLGGTAAERLPGALPRRSIAGASVPVLAFDPGAIAPAARARAALALHGVTFEDSSLSAAPAQDAAP
jgi:hypothetical protein